MGGKSKVEELLQARGNDARLVVGDKTLVFVGEWAVFSQEMGAASSRYFDHFSDALNLLTGEKP